MAEDVAFDSEQQWVIWNGSLGIVDTVVLGAVAAGQEGRRGWLDEPYDMVGPFDYDALLNDGQICFAACIVMSRAQWQRDQVALRRESHKLRREAQERLDAYNRSRQQYQSRFGYEVASLSRQSEYRTLLSLPASGDLKASDIKAAYRKLAQKAHPDQGGDHETFLQITEARDALLRQVA